MSHTIKVWQESKMYPCLPPNIDDIRAAVRNDMTAVWQVPGYTMNGGECGDQWVQVGAELAAMAAGEPKPLATRKFTAGMAAPTLLLWPFEYSRHYLIFEGLTDGLCASSGVALDDPLMAARDPRVEEVSILAAASVGAISKIVSSPKLGSHYGVVIVADAGTEKWWPKWLDAHQEAHPMASTVVLPTPPGIDDFSHWCEMYGDLPATSIAAAIALCHCLPGERWWATYQELYDQVSDFVTPSECERLASGTMNAIMNAKPKAWRPAGFVYQRPAAPRRPRLPEPDDRERADEVKARVPIRRVLDHFQVPQTERGNVRCPSIAHEDRNPSASITRQAGGDVLYCHSCGFGGDVFSVYAELSGLALPGNFAAVLEQTAALR